MPKYCVTVYCVSKKRIHTSYYGVFSRSSDAGAMQLLEAVKQMINRKKSRACRYKIALLRVEEVASAEL